MRAQETEVHDYARQLLGTHGDNAVAEAARMARTYEQQSRDDEAETWRRVEAALKLMRGPGVS